MKHGSLFSGIGGFDLAAEWMGWENVFHCEWNPFGQKVLKHYWPNAISYHDITKTDFTIHRGSIDIITGGFPCQPYSSAGKRLGKDDERHLWPEMLRCIREVSPRWIVGENVRGLTNWNGGMVFDEVQADLEAIDYEVLPFLLPACAVNAPHRRDRIWFIANGSGNGFKFTEKSKKINNKRFSEGMDERYEFDTQSIFRIATNTESKRSWKQPQEDRRWKDRRFDNNGEISNVTDTCDTRLERSKVGGSFGESRSQSHQQSSRFVRATWQIFPTVSPICNGDDGLSKRLDGITFPKWRNESIKAGGNAVVPQVVYQIFKAIEAYEAS